MDSKCDANVQIAVREVFRSVTRQIDERVHIRAGRYQSARIFAAPEAELLSGWL